MIQIITAIFFASSFGVASLGAGIIYSSRAIEKRKENREAKYKKMTKIVKTNNVKLVQNF